MKRRNIALMVLLLAMAGVTYTQAFTLTPLQQVAEFYEATTTESDRAISNFRSRPLGKNKILITFTLSAGTQDANVTVQPMDVDGNILTSQGTGSLIQYKAGTGNLVSWRTFPVAGEEMFFFYEYNSTTGPGYPGPVDIRVLFAIPNIVLNYETCLVEVRDY
ncbi:MAG: hypothetical protein ABIJ47_08470 [Candidatus Bathyarchaeota archaeon]